MKIELLIFCTLILCTISFPLPDEEVSPLKSVQREIKVEEVTSNEEKPLVVPLEKIKPEPRAVPDSEVPIKLNDLSSADLVKSEVVPEVKSIKNVGKLLQKESIEGKKYEEKKEDKIKKSIKEQSDEKLPEITKPNENVQIVEAKLVPSSEEKSSKEILNNLKDILTEGNIKMNAMVSRKKKKDEKTDETARKISETEETKQEQIKPEMQHTIEGNKIKKTQEVEDAKEGKEQKLVTKKEASDTLDVNENKNVQKEEKIKEEKLESTPNDKKIENNNEEKENKKEEIKGDKKEIKRDGSEEYSKEDSKESKEGINKKKNYEDSKSSDESK